MFEEIISNIVTNKVRFFLSSIGIGWGILILVVLTGVGRGFEAGIFNLFKGFSLNCIYAVAAKTTKPYKGNPAGRQISFTREDMAMLQSNIPEIQTVSPQMTVHKLVTAGEIASGYDIVGVMPEYFDMKLLKTASGRVLNVIDERERRMVALIGSNVAEMFFDKTNPVGKHLMIENNVFQVVGVIKNSMFNQMEARQIYLPYNVISTTFANGYQFPVLVFTYADKTDYERLKSRVVAFMGRKYAFAPDDSKAFYFSSIEEQVKAFNNLFATIRKFLWFIGISTLVGGVIGVANIMYASAKERTFEIGIRKAIGARKTAIWQMFVGESLITTFISGFAGILTGWGILRLLGQFIDSDTMLMDKPGLDVSTTVATFIILMICGTLAGLRPAIYAAKLNPIDSLHKEN